MSIALVVALIGCGTTRPDPLSPVPECTGPVTPSIGPGTTPEFSWAPACALAMVLVQPGGAPDDLWGVDVGDENSIMPPVTYGTTPPVAGLFAGPVTLVPGTEYELLLLRFSPFGDRPYEVIARQKFTP